MTNYFLHTHFLHFCTHYQSIDLSEKESTRDTNPILDFLFRHLKISGHKKIPYGAINTYVYKDKNEGDKITPNNVLSVFFLIYKNSNIR